MSDGPPRFRPFRKDFRWEDVDRLAYKDDGEAPFRDVTRQVLFASPDLMGELRYFEVGAGGFSSLERHRHVHAVMILRGAGRCLVGTEIRAVSPYDLVTVPPLTWHQFRAAADAPLGFLCLVNAERDRPEPPSPDDLATLCADPAIAAFLRGESPDG